MADKKKPIEDNGTGEARVFDYGAKYPEKAIQPGTATYSALKLPGAKSQYQYISEGTAQTNADNSAYTAKVHADKVAEAKRKLAEADTKIADIKAKIIADQKKLEVIANTPLTDEEKDQLEETKLRAGAEAYMAYDPETAMGWNQKADAIGVNRGIRSQTLSDKADAQAQSQKNDALTELADIDQNDPNAASDWTAIRNKWLTKSPKLDAYLPATPAFIDAKGNFGKLAERGYAEQLMKQAQSEKYLANSSTNSTERQQHLANAKEYEARAEKYGAQVAATGGTGNEKFDKFMAGYAEDVKIPDSMKSQWTAPEQKIINDHNAQVDQNKTQALDLAKGYEGLGADKFNNEVNQTLGASVEAAQKELEALKRGALSVQSAVKNNNTKGAAYMSMKKALGDALSGSDFSGMAGFGVSEGILGKIKEQLGAGQISEEKAKTLVKSFVDGLNDAITEYNSNVVEKTAKSEMKDKIISKFKITPVKAISTSGSSDTETPKAGEADVKVPKVIREIADQLKLTDVKQLGGKWRGTDSDGVVREVK